MNKAVFGIAKSYSHADIIVNNLVQAGFENEDISILAPDVEGDHDIGHIKASKAPEAATIGATTGGVAGGVLGLLAGIGLLAIPGAGPFIAAGPILGALSGLGVGAATGGIVGGLVGLGIPEIEARLYDSKLKDGNYLISVHVSENDDLDNAKQVFKNSDAENVSVVDEHKVDGRNTSDRAVASAELERSH